MEEAIKIVGAEYDDMGDILVLHLLFDEEDQENIDKFLSMQTVITDSIS